jgi:hypothetical protein
MWASNVRSRRSSECSRSLNPPSSYQCAASHLPLMGRRSWATSDWVGVGESRSACKKRLNAPKSAATALVSVGLGLSSPGLGIGILVAAARMGRRDGVASPPTVRDLQVVVPGSVVDR